MVEIEIAEQTTLEIDGSKARVVKGNGAGSWHELPGADIEVKVISSDVLRLQAYGNYYLLEIKGLDITIK